jgi:polyhydroxyalkanoate synthesis repressor PhaR
MVRSELSAFWTEERMPETRVIKRYANRKLYDTQRSRYVTLDQIAGMIRAGEDVKIVDNTSKEDLTALTLTQILFEEEKKGGFLPLAALRNIIQSGGESISSIATQAQEKVRAVFRRDKDGEGEAPEAPPPEEAPAVESHESPGAVKALLERSQSTLDEWQKKIDERVQKVVEAVSPFAGVEKEIRALRDRIAELEKRIEEHEKDGS